MRHPSLVLLWSCTPVIPDTNIESDDPVERSPGVHDSADTGSNHLAENQDIRAEVHSEVNCILKVDWNRVSTADQTWVEFEFAGQMTLTSPARPAKIGAHSALLLGTPCDTEVDYRIITQTGDETRRSTDYSAWTGSKPWSLPNAEVLTWNPDLATSDRWVLGSLDVSQSSWYGDPSPSSSWIDKVESSGTTRFPIADSRYKPRSLGTAATSCSRARPTTYGTTTYSPP